MKRTQSLCEQSKKYRGWKERFDKIMSVYYSNQDLISSDYEKQTHI